MPMCPGGRPMQARMLLLYKVRHKLTLGALLQPRPGGLLLQPMTVREAVPDPEGPPIVTSNPMFIDAATVRLPAVRFPPFF